MSQASSFNGFEHDDAFDVDWLRVDGDHELYFEQYGNPEGKAVIYLHGGPGGHISKPNTVFFSPKTYRTVLLDQRGCGRSRPNASIHNNTTWHLVADIETLRQHLKISKWHIVFGGSWGSTLALAYAQTHPSSVGSLVLRGIFTVREFELKWTMLPGGASKLFPEHFEEFLNFLPEEERADHIEAYNKRLMSDDERVSHPAARAWNKWELSISTLYPNLPGLAQLDDTSFNLAHARIEAHYFRNRAWLEEGQLLRKENIDKIRDIPMTIVQGRYDVVCPSITAWDLHKAWPESKLHLINDAGHSVTEPGTTAKLIEVVEEYASLSIER
ncbi:proline iminopeptidase [Pseudovirgaria hyperparasitica]|uniref:Proline iminopeptidase n=1 Tax=Pseudovirgaria hyperparasitica TaxID=470096 RepID=A0A6A6VZ87_9PEZI|nr:proline iminopeptidase [Pseudovirgaria hyperparasitica]KAF2754637.1 proline iminopeptidase [Pseudovirgaria hyperparasitica]